MLLDRLKNYSLVLASQSPRRKELLENMGLQFVVEKPTVAERYPDELSPQQLAEHLAVQKAMSVHSLYDPQSTIIIGGDTIVCVNNTILEKPKDKKDAAAMLTLLSGKRHKVISGICVCHNQKIAHRHDVTHVCFETLSSEEINYYIEKYQPFDKAGAYGIQEWAGHTAISLIKGSYYNVMGLPTHLLWQMLKETVP
jgi:septum formation protein